MGLRCGLGCPEQVPDSSRVFIPGLGFSEVSTGTRAHRILLPLRRPEAGRAQVTHCPPICTFPMPSGVGFHVTKRAGLFWAGEGQTSRLPGAKRQGDGRTAQGPRGVLLGLQGLPTRWLGVGPEPQPLPSSGGMQLRRVPVLTIPACTGDPRSGLVQALPGLYLFIYLFF